MVESRTIDTSTGMNMSRPDTSSPGEWPCVLWNAYWIVYDAIDAHYFYEAANLWVDNERPSSNG